MKNQLAKIIDKLQAKPRWLRGWLTDFALGSSIKFIGTAGLHCEELTQEKAVFVLRNRKKVQNHIGSVHAAATGLLAETATGMLFGMNLPDDKLPLLKTMHIDYIARSTGDLKATASIDKKRLEALHIEDKGDIQVSVTVIDEKGVEPVNCQLVWAWVKK